MQGENIKDNTQHFNSHAHVERDKGDENAAKQLEISTHTLTWSVTTLVTAYNAVTNIFQLTRSRGA